MLTLTEVTLSWAPYSGGQFGEGFVICTDEGQLRFIALPKPEMTAPDCRRATAGDLAVEVAAELELAISQGRDVRHLISELPPGGSPFMRQVLQACWEIPPGETRTYSELASLAGNSKAARAAGTAMATNRLPLVIPCHRVVPAGGGVGSYGGGAQLKRWLLEREKETART